MTKIINRKLIEESLNFPELVDYIEKYYQLLKKGTVTVTPRTFTPTQDKGLFISGGAINFENENFIVMSQPVMPWLGEQGLPVATTTYMYSSFRTGELKAVIGGSDLVKYRTPAKSALAAKYLAVKKKEYTLGLIGMGIQAVTHAQAFSALFNVTRVLAHARTPEKRKHNLAEIESKMGKGVELLSKEEVIKQADILVVITSAKEPIVHFSDLHKGQLLIGTDHAETVAKDVALQADKVFVDYRPTAENENATIKILLEEGNKYEDLVDGDLLQLTGGEITGRSSDTEIIFFQSLGVLNENLAAVEYFYNKVQNMATEVEI